MLEHLESIIGISVDDQMLCVGISGTVDGELGEASLQFGLQDSEQDTKLGLTGLYFDYNQLGGYRIVDLVRVIGRKRVEINLSVRALDLGIPARQINFSLTETASTEILRALVQMCDRSTTSIICD
jgi:hypothetical protein